MKRIYRHVAYYNNEGDIAALADMTPNEVANYYENNEGLVYPVDDEDEIVVPEDGSVPSLPEDCSFACEGKYIIKGLRSLEGYEPDDDESEDGSEKDSDLFVDIYELDKSCDRGLMNAVVGNHGRYRRVGHDEGRALIDSGSFTADDVVEVRFKGKMPIDTSFMVPVDDPVEPEHYARIPWEESGDWPCHKDSVPDMSLDSVFVPVAALLDEIKRDVVIKAAGKLLSKLSVENAVTCAGKIGWLVTKRMTEEVATLFIEHGIEAVKTQDLEESDINVFPETFVNMIRLVGKVQEDCRNECRDILVGSLDLDHIDAGIEYLSCLPVMDAFEVYKYVKAVVKKVDEGTYKVLDDGTVGPVKNE